jgi:SAM-dependent methyltransferase
VYDSRARPRNEFAQPVKYTEYTTLFDLLKWGSLGANLGFVCGVDISPASLEELHKRYEVGKSKGTMRFPIDPFRGDCSKNLRAEICARAPLPNRMFDCVSSMFSLHYNFSSLESIDNYFTNVTCALKPGGRFFGTFCSGEAVLNLLMEAQSSHYQDPVEDFAVTFKSSDEKIFAPGDGIGLPYQFRLGQAVEDIDEYVTLWSTLCAAAARHGRSHRCPYRTTCREPAQHSVAPTGVAPAGAISSKQSQRRQ